MKKNLTLTLILSLLLGLALLSSCGTSKTDGSETTAATASASGSSGSGSTEAEDGYTVTFVTDDDVSVTVYQTQDDMTDGSNGEVTTTALSRDADTGTATKDGTGQVNFLLVFSDGYELDNITIDKEEDSGYGNLKGSADTEITNGYRITKITSDLTVTVTAKSTNEEEDLTQGYQVTFSAGEHVSVTVFKTQDLTSGGTENATVAYSRDGTTGALTLDGGQVNFLLVFDDGYELDTLDVNGSYKNLKDSADTGVTNAYRITKIASALTVVITAKATS